MGEGAVLVTEEGFRPVVSAVAPAGIGAMATRRKSVIDNAGMEDWQGTRPSAGGWPRPPTDGPYSCTCSGCAMRWNSSVDSNRCA